MAQATGTLLRGFRRCLQFELMNPWIYRYLIPGFGGEQSITQFLTVKKAAVRLYKNANKNVHVFDVTEENNQPCL